MSAARTLLRLLQLALLTLPVTVRADCVADIDAPGAEALWDTLTGAAVFNCRRASVQAQLDRLQPVRRGEPDLDQLFTVWQALAADWDGAQAGADAALRDLYAGLGQRAALAARHLRDGQSALQDVSRASAWRIDNSGALGPMAGTGDDLVAPGVAVERLLTEACAAEGAECPRILARADEILAQIMLAGSIGAILGQSTITGLLDKVAEVNADWDRFLFDSKPMYPWSLWLTDRVNRRRASYQRRHGLLEPPDTQYFLLHPAPGFAYTGAADDGDQLAPTVYVELLGFNRWRARYLTGVSAIVEYADRAGVEDTSYGALFTFANRYSIGITTGGGDIGVTLGLDLANLYRERLQPQISRIRSAAD